VDTRAASTDQPLMALRSRLREALAETAAMLWGPSSLLPDQAQEARRPSGPSGKAGGMGTALPGLADDGHADLVRELTSVMRDL
jgi:hypothetical protein